LVLGDDVTSAAEFLRDGRTGGAFAGFIIGSGSTAPHYDAQNQEGADTPYSKLDHEFSPLYRALNHWCTAHFSLFCGRTTLMCVNARTGFRAQSFSND
jgi:hypothetical protein